MHLRYLALTVALAIAAVSAPTTGVGAEEFRVENLDLDVFDLAAASSMESPDALRDLPAPDSPMGVVLRLAHVYALGRVAEYGRCMTTDFRYEFAEPALQEQYPQGFGREDEMTSLDHVVHGFVDRNGVARPRARSMRLRFDLIESVEDPDFPADPVSHAMVRVRARLDITLETGEALGAFEGRQEFHVVRGDRATAAAGGRRSAERWYVRRWVEREMEAGLVATIEIPEVSVPPGSPVGGGGQAESRESAAKREATLRFSVAVARSGGAPGAAGSGEAGSGAVHAQVALADAGEARLDLFDVSGRRVAACPLGWRDRGSFEVQVANRGALASGIYWLRLQQAHRVAVAKLHLLR